MKILRFLLFLFLLCGSNLSFAQLLTYKNFNHKDGLHMASILSFGQSEDGLIWLGTDGASIVHFNGENFNESIIKNDNHHVNSISFNGDSVLFSSSYLGFYSYSKKDGETTKFDLRDHLFGEAIGSYAKNGYIYFIGTKEIISFKEKSKTLKRFEPSQKKLIIYQKIESKRLLILLTNHGGFILKDGVFSLLSDWVTSVNGINNYHYGYFDDSFLFLIHKNGTSNIRIKLDEKNNQIVSIVKNKLSSSFDEVDKIISFTFNKHYQLPTFLTEQGNIFFLKNSLWRHAPHNFSEKIYKPYKIYTDLNGDLWILSKTKGVYKVSKEPFTKIQLSEPFTKTNIYFVHSFESGINLLSTGGGKTLLETSPNSYQFKEYNFSTNAITEIDNGYFLATNKGLWIYRPEKNPIIDEQFYKNQNISYVTSFGNDLWIGISGKGIFKYNLNDHIKKTPTVNRGRMPEHFYTSQISNDRKSIFFGTNTGIYKLNIKSNILNKVHLNTIDLGSYSGISTTDSYGTNWFTLEKGIVGFTKNHKMKIIKGEKHFNSTLFYTLIADNIGNLIVGTNRGLTILKIDEDANIIYSNVYDEKTSFLGYETHIRSQFKRKSEILLGTVEGLFQINTSFLKSIRVPTRPNIEIIEDVNTTEETDAFNFLFRINNPKINTIVYKYTTDGSRWKVLENGKNSIFVSGLSSGKHTIKVKASYDGINFGDVATREVIVNLPLWKSTWFIALIIALLFILNIFLLNYYRTPSGTSLIDTKDIDVHLNLTPAILLFAAITTPLTHLLAPIMDPQLSLNIGTSLLTTFILLLLYLSSLSAKSAGKAYLYSTLLRIGLFAIMADFLWEVYDSQLHPYNIMGVILISTMAPYVLSKVKDTMVFASVILFVSVLFILVLNDTVYPKYYFLLVISVTSFLIIFYSFLRYDSLEKLIFVSSIINKGNMPVIAFDKKGTIIYSSENISSFLDTSHTDILDKNITILNNFIPFDRSYKDTDITREFKDGEKYLAPMIDKESEIRWMEWAYRDFSEDVKLILGQDITEKMALENTYEVLVQYAKDFIYKCDSQGNFKFINDEAYLRLGYTKKDLIGKYSLNIVAKEYRDEIIQFYKSHFVNKSMTSYKEFPIVKKNGDYIWVGQSITTLFSPGSNSKIDGFIALARDITEIRTQQELISEQSSAITSSINYARRIQHNLLPSEKQFKDAFKDHFIFAKPKDIVSGDFYWMEKVGENIILVLGDCTGHGVPGSFMTLLGFNLLNSTVLENRITDPGKILDRVDKKLIEYLPRGTGKNFVNDAMELTVCVFNDKSYEMAYACAGSRFLISHQREITMFKGDNKHCGDIEEKFLGYNTHFANFNENSNLFLFSDGFQDQFGGVKDKKYSFRRLIELFEENINLPLSEQQKLISESFEKWIGDTEQTDDVTVISVIRAILKENNSL